MEVGETVGFLVGTHIGTTVQLFVGACMGNEVGPIWVTMLPFELVKAASRG